MKVGIPKRILAIGAIGLVSIIYVSEFLSLRVDDRDHDSVTLWSEDRSQDPEASLEIHSLFTDLERVEFEAFDVTDISFVDALEQFAGTWNSITSVEPISFKIDPEVGRENLVSASFGLSKADDILRHLSIQNSSSAKIQAGRVIMIEPIDVGGRDDSGWFRPDSSYIESISVKGSGIVDLRPHLESAGIEFREHDVAEYNWTTGLLWAENTRDQMELIDAYFSSTIVCYQPSWWERLRDRWFPPKKFLSSPSSIASGKGGSPAGPPAASAPRTPDPF